MKTIKILLFISLIFMMACRNEGVTAEEKEIAKIEIDSMVNNIKNDTLVLANIPASVEVKKEHKKHTERIVEELEKSAYKDVPCKKIIDELKAAVDQYCSGKITIDQLTSKIPDMDDTKIKLCVNENYQKEYDKIVEQIELCMEKRGN
ncbi:MAG: hypothetical protein IPN87_07035 [Saprospiraceae bacterium]|uniref:hypothetical protein n=1 Tax=Candidatus Brachybacter algidus TaxID=2982024 RepID=UPI00257BE8E4|nr:hypothetical protein [Candidatus Brachybacter algidus]MBK7603102.1 hypothetical protein [Candidatus Brachybacter algidus]MBK8602843.1 hypothetical protein [Candidatus Brachybacter algidus]